VPTNHIAAQASMLCSMTFWVWAVAAAVSSPAKITASATTRATTAGSRDRRTAAM
jgi:hypothetical protein